MKEHPSPPVAPRARRRPALGALAFVLVAIAALAFGSCRSLDKQELGEALLALPKNAPLADIGGFRTTPMALELDGTRHELDLRYLLAEGPSENAATPVLLVHGTPSTAASWVEIMLGGDGFEGLSAKRDVYAIEIVGHGIAEGDIGEVTFQRCARFVAAAIDALGLDTVHLVGGSYGGEFAWRAALDASDSVAGLVLLDSSGYRREDEEFLPEEVDMREMSLAKIGWLLNSSERITTALAPHFEEIPPDRVEEFRLVCDNAANWSAMIDLVRDENGGRADELKLLRVPTLLLWGERDIAYPPERFGERFAADLPDARLVVLPSGHYPHEERPADVIREMERFFESLDR